MERFERAHAREDSVWLGIGGGVPGLGDVGRGRVKRVVTFIVEGHCLKTVLSFLDVGT
mgnify:CR=1 FL=1